MIHELKTDPEFFGRVWDGLKRAELRRDDRGFRAGDGLRLREFDPRSGSYSGRRVDATVTDVVRDAPGFGLMDGFALLSLRIDARLCGDGGSGGRPD